MSQLHTDAKVNTAQVAIAWVLAFLTIGYMLPWAIAETRGKSNGLAIGLVNFLAGWTIIGWIVALVMACGSHQVVHGAPAFTAAPQVWTDPATGHVLTMNPVNGQPMRIDPTTGAPWVEQPGGIA